MVRGVAGSEADPAPLVDAVGEPTVDRRVEVAVVPAEVGVALGGLDVPVDESHLPLVDGPHGDRQGGAQVVRGHQSGRPGRG